MDVDDGGAKAVFPTKLCWLPMRVVRSWPSQIKRTMIVPRSRHRLAYPLEGNLGTSGKGRGRMGGRTMRRRGGATWSEAIVLGDDGVKGGGGGGDEDTCS